MECPLDIAQAIAAHAPGVTPDFSSQAFDAFNAAALDEMLDKVRNQRG
jgi:hypothetical protein